MQIMEIFQSIQGEGKYMGKPMTFVRTGGCNLHCSWCDTKESWAVAPEWTAKEILAAIRRQKAYGTVVITGGEPTIQPDLFSVVIDLRMAGYKVHLETNGTEDIAAGYFHHVVCSPKREAEYRVAIGADELKYVIDDNFDPVKAIPGWVRHKYEGRIWLQPCDYGDRNTAQECIRLAMQDPRLRVGVQLHKVLGVK